MKWRRYNVTLLAILVVSSALNVLQSKRIWSLYSTQNQAYATPNEGITSARTSSEGPSSYVLVPKLPVRDLENHDVDLVVGSDDKPTVIYVFSPSCVWCERNASAVRSLAAQAPGRYTLVGLSLSSEGLSEFISKHRMDFPVYKDLADPLVKLYAIGMTPEVLVLRPDGRLVARWRGAFFRGDTKALIERFFSVKISS